MYIFKARSLRSLAHINMLAYLGLSAILVDNVILIVIKFAIRYRM